MSEQGQPAKGFSGHTRAFFSLYLKRFQENQLEVYAGYLTYITSLSMVPLVAVMFSVIGAFPMFEEWRAQLETFLYSNVVPSAGEEIQKYIQGFVDNIGRMTAVGVGALMVVALMLIHNIVKTINRIWRIHKGPRLIISFSIYWMLLTCGPILMGASIAITSYLITLSSNMVAGSAGIGSALLSFMPFLFSLIAFFLLFLLVPNTKVRHLHALAGASLTAVLFEVLKQGFGLYLVMFPTYTTIYGAMALVPILFLWTYLVWNVVLLGVQFTAVLQELYPPRQKEPQERAQDCDDQSPYDSSALPDAQPQLKS